MESFCIISLNSTFCFITKGGYYVLTLVDWYAATFSVTAFALIELLVMTYVYGKYMYNIKIWSKNFLRVLRIAHALEESTEL